MIVVGGGPAGSGTAIWLAEQGVSVVLFDRANFPRDKACGEFLTPQAARLLRDLGVWEHLMDAGIRPVAATVLVSPKADGGQMRYAPDDRNVGWAMRRTTLDAILLARAREAGVAVHEGFAVRSVCREESGSGQQVVGITGKDADGEPHSVGARLIVGADGTHSLIARQLNMVKALPRLQRLAIVAHFRNVSGNGDTIEMRASEQTVCGMGFPGGGSSAGNTGHDANLTLVVPTSQASQIAGRAGDFVEQTLQSKFPLLAERLAGADREQVVRTVGCYGHRCRPAVADGVLLVGDAATFIDPFTGEGVYFALRGAQHAAETASEALRRGDTSRRGLAAYTGARCELSRRYQLLDIVQTVVRTPALLSRAVCRLDRYPAAAARLFNVLGGTRPPTDVLHPALLWRLLAPV